MYTFLQARNMDIWSLNDGSRERGQQNAGHAATELGNIEDFALNCKFLAVQPLDIEREHSTLLHLAIVTIFGPTKFIKMQ